MFSVCRWLEQKKDIREMKAPCMITSHRQIRAMALRFEHFYIQNCTPHIAKKKEEYIISVIILTYKNEAIGGKLSKAVKL